MFEPIECSGEFYPSDKIADAKNNIGEATKSDIDKTEDRTGHIEDGGIYRSISHAGDKWMELACRVALESVGSGGGPFGAVLLQIDSGTNEIIRYWQTSNRVTSLNDPTAHAEVMAIRSACKSLEVFDLGEIRRGRSRLPQKGELSHCIMYSSCEPCPMCYSAIMWARIEHLFFAATRYDAAVPGVDFSDEEIYDELSRPYNQRKVSVRHCSVPNSLDAFNLWKKTDKIKY